MQIKEGKLFSPTTVDDPSPFVNVNLLAVSAYPAEIENFTISARKILTAARSRPLDKNLFYVRDKEEKDFVGLDG